MIIRLQRAPHLAAQPADRRENNEMARFWHSKYRDEVIELRVKSDPHSPAYYRVNGVVPNVDAFYETFNVREGDGQYLPPEKRVRTWR
jgi:endothelin-converting enzyme/putative endopeptidase